jgi:hypothetical protein
MISLGLFAFRNPLPVSCLSFSHADGEGDSCAGESGRLESRAGLAAKGVATPLFVHRSGLDPGMTFSHGSRRLGFVPSAQPTGAGGDFLNQGAGAFDNISRLIKTAVSGVRRVQYSITKLNTLFMALVSVVSPFAAATSNAVGLALETHTIVQHGIYRDAVVDQGASISDRTRATAGVDLVIDYQPTIRNQFWSRLRWAQGNALNNTGGLVLAPYGGDVEDDVKDINGHNRDYLLEAWFKHGFVFDPDASLDVTAGLIDASSYIDSNAFAGDETTQFMNEALVLNNLAGIPAYDTGMAFEYRTGRWSARAVTMRTRDEYAGDYYYAATEVGVGQQLPVGEGNYRLFGFTTSSDFEDPNKGKKKPLRGGGISIDQYLGEWLGVFARIGYQNHVAVDYERLVSVGVHFDGMAWGRPADSAGIGIARLEGEDHSSLNHTDVIEAYSRFVFSEQVDLSFDVQYMRDAYDGSLQNPRVVVLGTRLNLSF